MSTLPEQKRAYDFEEMKYISEYHKQQYDFFKHMTTINTGAILIIVALSQYIFGQSKLRWLLMFSIASLFISLIYSVKLMRLFIIKGIRNIWRWYHVYHETKKEREDFSNEAEKYNKYMSLSLIIGIAIFIVLSILSYFI